MKLHNTLTKKIDEFRPIDSIAKIYSCGPTVYNYAHIGNLSSYIYADELRRAVELAGYDAHQVMNLTDVDDKTIRDSRLEFPNDEPVVALKKLTTKYSRIFIDEMREIGNKIGADLDAGETFRDGFNLTRATNNIDGIQNLVRKLLREKIAYVADDGIYFSIAEYQKTRKYGQLSDISVGSSRIDNDEYDKDNARDFALWKRQKPGEPSWDFIVDRQFLQSNFAADNNLAGRPGWHIECSVMSTRFLDQPFDIHTGGIDLIFPHHENEIAQSTAGDQPEKFANFFVHNEHLLVDGKKMSKSAHNFYTLADIKNRGFSALDFRMFVLQSHYRSATNFSWKNLTAAKNRLANWKNFANLRWQNFATEQTNESEFVEQNLARAKEKILDNLNTPEALVVIDDIIGRATNGISITNVERVIDFVDQNFGLKLLETTPDITNEEKTLIRNREIARTEKSWQKSDELRDELSNRHGIFVKDRSNGTIWSRS